MKKLALYIIACVLALTACTDGGKASKTEKPADSVPVMVMQIRKCSKLYTAEYKIHKIVTHDDKVELKGSLFNNKFNIPVPMSSRKIAIPIDAKLKAYIDFDGFSEKNISVLTSSRIGHDEIKKHVSLIRSNFTDAEMSGYERQGREAIIKSIPQLGIIEMAKESATHALVPMLTRLGYKEENITITFRKNFTTEDLPLILDNRTIENGKR